MYLNKIIDVLRFVRETIGKKDMPLYWLELFLKVAEHGEFGVTTKEIAEELGMTQGIASRTVKLMSRYVNPKTKQCEGFDLLVSVKNDMIHRHRQRLYLSEHGKQVVEQIWKILLPKSASNKIPASNPLRDADYVTSCVTGSIPTKQFFTSVTQTVV